MAYSPIEQRYIDMVVEAYFPTMAPEPTPEEASLDGVQLAAADVARLPEVVVTGEPEADGPSGPAGEPQPRFGRGGVTKAQSDAAGGFEVPATALIDTLAGALRGTVAQSLGLPGDIESLVRLLSGGKQVLPTTEQVNEMLPPVVPPSAPNAAERQKTADVANLLGEYNPLLGAPEAAKLAVKGAKAAGKALAPTVGDMAEDYLRKTGGLIDVAPGKFNPKTELPKAIESVLTNPDSKIYLPQAQRAPSVALRLAGVDIQGTGEKGTITVNDVGTILEKSQLALNKNKPLDPTKPKDLAKMVDSATAEAEYQMSQPISGATWYEDDVHQAFMLGSKIVPELATDEPLRVMTTAFAASTSYNKRAGENWPVALRITEHLMKTGQMASRNPDNGKLWGGTTGPIMEQQLKLHDYMIKRMGMDKYAEWLLSPHTVKEIAEMKTASGLYKTPGIPGKATDLKMGAFILGEKGGAFFLNLNGIKETTADKWFTRTYNRHTGTLTNGPVSEQGLVDTPRNEAERAIMKQWNRAVASNIKLDEQANQAVLWYYEQSLYYNLGVKSARSESFSDGAKNLLNTRGIPFTEAELAGARNLRNARQTSTESTGSGGARNPISLGQTTPAARTTVTRSRTAPKTGAE